MTLPGLSLWIANAVDEFLRTVVSFLTDSDSWIMRSLTPQEELSICFRIFLRLASEPYSHEALQQLRQVPGHCLDCILTLHTESVAQDAVSPAALALDFHTLRDFHQLLKHLPVEVLAAMRVLYSRLNIDRCCRSFLCWTHLPEATPFHWTAAEVDAALFFDKMMGPRAASNILQPLPENDLARLIQVRLHQELKPISLMHPSKTPVAQQTPCILMILPIRNTTKHGTSGSFMFRV